FGATLAGRPPALAGVDEMIGLFINTLPVRVRVAPAQPLLAWLQQLQAQQAELRRYEYSPLAQVQAWSKISSGQPLFESLLVFENYPVDAALREQEGSLDIQAVRSIELINYPLTLIALPGPELTLRLLYDPSRFDHDAITRMLAHLQQLLVRMLADPAQHLADLSPLTEAERQQLLVAWNAPVADAAPADCICIHAAFAAQVAASPTATAIVADGVALSYHELDRRANQLAHYLRAQGVGPEVLVGLWLDRSLDLVVGMLGVLKAGGA